MVQRREIVIFVLYFNCLCDRSSGPSIIRHAATQGSGNRMMNPISSSSFDLLLKLCS